MPKNISIKNQDISMYSGKYVVLKNSQNSLLDLNVAVFLAEASQAAYADVISPAAWAIASGFPTATLFDRDNVQGFWCAVDDVALLVFRGTSNPGQWLRDARFFPAAYPWGKVSGGPGFLDRIFLSLSVLLRFRLPVG